MRALHVLGLEKIFDIVARTMNSSRKAARAHLAQHSLDDVALEQHAAAWRRHRSVS